MYFAYHGSTSYKKGMNSFSWMGSVYKSGSCYKIDHGSFYCLYFANNLSISYKKD